MHCLAHAQETLSSFRSVCTQKRWHLFLLWISIWYFYVSGSWRLRSTFIHLCRHIYVSFQDSCETRRKLYKLFIGLSGRATFNITILKPVKNSRCCRKGLSDHQLTHNNAEDVYENDSIVPVISFYLFKRNTKKRITHFKIPVTLIADLRVRWVWLDWQKKDRRILIGKR